MQTKTTISRGIIIAVGLLFASAGYAFDMGNVMNPSKWMGGGRDRDRYDDYDRGYGYPGGPGYGYGAPGYGPAPYYGGPPGAGYGYGAPGYGAVPGYGYGAAPAYGVAPGYGGAPGNSGAPAYGGAPNYGGASSGADTAEQIERLQERIRVLEEEARRSQQTNNPAWGNNDTQPNYSAPAAPYGGAQPGNQYQYR